MDRFKVRIFLAAFRLKTQIFDFNRGFENKYRVIYNTIDLIA